MVDVNLNKEYIIDFGESPWNALSQSMMNPFRIMENKAICDAYPDGLFPGANDSGWCQSIKIYKFENYLEFSKIVEDEITSEGALTTLFYIRRNEGWKSKEVMKKKGNVIGYCVNCFIYHPDDIEEVYKTIYGKTFYKLVFANPIFKNLKLLQSSNNNLIFKGESDIFIKQIRKLLSQ